MGIGIRRGAALLAGLLVILAGIWSAAGSAWAGGPTSVLMVNPSTGGAAALHTSDARYQRLVDAVGAYDPPTGSTHSPAGGTEDCSDCQIRLTWMIHDMTVWRIDRVYLTDDDGIWLQSVSAENGSGNLLEQPARWQRPNDPEALLTLLHSSGVVSEAVEAGDGPARADRVAAAGGSAPSAPLALVGFVTGAAGVAIGLAGGWLVRRRHSTADRDVLTG